MANLPLPHATCEINNTVKINVIIDKVSFAESGALTGGSFSSPYLIILLRSLPRNADEKSGAC